MDSGKNVIGNRLTTNLGTWVNFHTQTRKYKIRKDKEDDRGKKEKDGRWKHHCGLT